MSAAPVPAPPTDRQALEEAEMRIRCLFRRLGLEDPQSLDILVHDCMQRARKRAQDQEELPRRAVEEARRRYDLWLGRALEPLPDRSLQELARARAALLLGPRLGSAEGLLPGKGLSLPVREALRAVFPQPVPPEAPVAMPAQAISFVSFTGRKHRRQAQ